MSWCESWPATSPWHLGLATSCSRKGPGLVAFSRSTGSVERTGWRGPLATPSPLRRSTGECCPLDPCGTLREETQDPVKAVGFGKEWPPQLTPAVLSVVLHSALSKNSPSQVLCDSLLPTLTSHHTTPSFFCGSAIPQLCRPPDLPSPSSSCCFTLGPGPQSRPLLA